MTCRVGLGQQVALRHFANQQPGFLFEMSTKKGTIDTGTDHADQNNLHGVTKLAKTVHFYLNGQSDRTSLKRPTRE